MMGMPNLRSTVEDFIFILKDQEQLVQGFVIWKIMRSISVGLY